LTCKDFNIRGTSSETIEVSVCKKLCKDRKKIEVKVASSSAMEDIVVARTEGPPTSPQSPELHGCWSFGRLSGPVGSGKIPKSVKSWTSGNKKVAEEVVSPQEH
jgi:hypothetical protein